MKTAFVILAAVSFCVVVCTLLVVFGMVVGYYMGVMFADGYGTDEVWDFYKEPMQAGTTINGPHGSKFSGMDFN